METVHVLLRQNRRINHRFADGFWQRRLDQNSVQPRIGVQPRQQREQFAFARGFGQNVGFGKNAEFGTGLFLAADIDLGRRIFADTNEREARSDPALAQFNDALRQFPLDLRGDGAPVNDIVTVWGCRR